MVKDRGKIKVKIFRFDPSTDRNPHYETHAIPFIENMGIASALYYIYEHIDSSLSFNLTCLLGKCGACEVLANGHAARSCISLVQDGMTVEPPHQLGFVVIKDLVASDVMFSTRDKLFVPRANAFHRFNKAYQAIRKE